MIKRSFKFKSLLDYIDEKEPTKRKPKPKTKELPAKQDLLLAILNQSFDEEWVTEYKFHPIRKWRMDYACPSLKICIEIDGGIFIGGRHSRPVGMLKDNEKLNTAASMGWLVLKFTPQQKLKTDTIELIRQTARTRKESR